MRFILEADLEAPGAYRLCMLREKSNSGKDTCPRFRMTQAECGVVRCSRRASYISDMQNLIEAGGTGNVLGRSTYVCYARRILRGVFLLPKISQKPE